MAYDDDRESETPTENLFEKFGLSAVEGTVEVGQTYPVYGMITAIEKVNDDYSTVVIINRNIRAILNISDKDKVNLIHERVFEPGIFVATFVKQLVPTDENPVAYEATVQTVVFGKKQSYDA